MNEIRIGVVGLGYVGLPLALEFGKKFPTIGFDISERRVEKLTQHFDENGDVGLEEFKLANKIQFTSHVEDLMTTNFIIVAVPTPVDSSNTPDLTILKNACKVVGQCLSNNCIVVFESTVYPGATEEDCVPILEKYSGKKWKKDFFVGYSPERINPGDKVHTLDKIIKVVSGIYLRPWK
jgi:UDP-N-acetyl-D-galactosamine dehydrogenase